VPPLRFSEEGLLPVDDEVDMLVVES